MKNKKTITIGIVALLLLGSGIAYANNSTNTSTPKQETTTVKDDKDKPKTTTSSKDESKESSEEKKESTNDSSVKNESEDKSSDSETTNTSSKSTSTKETTNKNSSSTSNKNTSSSSSSSSNSGSSTTKPSSGGSSSSGSGNSGSTTTKPTHTHTWVQQYKTVHHDAVYDNKYVVDQAAYDEQAPKYEMREHAYCTGCNADITSLSEAEWIAHAKVHMKNGEPSGWYSGWVQEQVGYDTVHHDEVGHYEKVLVKAAYDEKVPNGYKCSCGAQK